MKGLGFWLAIAAGYVAAFALAGLIVSLRYIGVPKATVDASSGMYAFGDFMGVLILGAVLSLVPTWFALRRLHDAERFWGRLSRVAMFWAVLAPLAGGVIWCSSFLTASKGVIPTFVHLSSLLRLFVAPGSAGVMAAAWWMCRRWPPVRRRFLVAFALEALGIGIAGAWFVGALLGNRG